MRLPPAPLLLARSPDDEVREAILDGIAVQRAMVADLAKNASPTGERPDGTFIYPKTIMVDDPIYGRRTLQDHFDDYSRVLWAMNEVHARTTGETVTGNTGHSALLVEQARQTAYFDKLNAELQKRIRDA